MNIIIKKATITDLPAVQALNLKLFFYSHILTNVRASYKLLKIFYFLTFFLFLLIVPISTLAFDLSTNESADIVIGQPGFNPCDNALSGGSYETGLSSPQRLFFSSGKLFVADTSNTRILIYNSLPAANNSTPDTVIGKSHVCNIGYNPLLSSPRGIASNGTKLVIADTSNNRVLIWNTMPDVATTTAQVVIGQTNMTGVSANQGATVATSTLSAPRDVYITADSKLIIADTGNNRVLIFNSIPATNGAEADIVIGQPNMISSAANNGGLKANTMSSPRGISSDGTKLFITDYTNNRILIFNTVPAADNASADTVIGQASKTTGLSGTTSTTLKNPENVFYSNSKLFVADTSNNRVLIFNAVPTSDGVAADVAVGQNSLTTGSANQGGSTAAANTLSAPTAAYSDGTNLIIADSSNNRVLIFNSIPASHNGSADVAIGQTSLILNSANQQGSVSASTLYNPRAAIVYGEKLFVVELSNNRVLIFNSIPVTNGASADVVIGQSDFTSTAANQGGSAGANTLSGPNGLYYDGSKLFISDFSNGRVLIYNSIPTSNNASANVIITNGTGVTQRALVYPLGLYSDGTRLFISDYGNNRVLIYNSIPASNDALADVVIGQQDFMSYSANQGLGAPAANTLSGPRSVYSDGTKLFILDYYNHRVLIYNSIPTSNNASADVVIGQPDFASYSANQGGNPAANTLSLSNGISGGLFVIDNRLFIADQGNNRVLLFNSIPTDHNASANVVIGQSDFTSKLANQGGSTAANTLMGPVSVFSDGSRLFIADQNIHRVLIYYLKPKFPTLGSAQAISSSHIRYNLTDNSQHETGFKLYSGSGLLSTNANHDLTYFDETGLSPNTQYSGRYVVAYNDSGTSSSSTPPAALYTLAGTPTNLSASSNSNSVTLTVDSFSNDTSGSSGYYFYNSTTGANSGWIQTNSWQNTDLSCGNTYTYLAKYRNGDEIETSFIPLTELTSGCGGGNLPPGIYNPPVATSANESKITVNQGANATADRIINLNFSAGSDVKKMAISLTGDFTDATPEDYQPAKQFDLCSKFSGLIKNQACSDGQYTVHVKFYTQYGAASEVISTKINLAAALQSSKPAINSEASNTVPAKAEPAAAPPAAKPAIPFAQDMRPGSRSIQIKDLQKFLNQHGFKLTDTGFGSPGNETDFFGALTYKALAKFQEANKDKVPELVKEKGYLGAITRNFINSFGRAVLSAKEVSATAPDLPSAVFTVPLYNGLQSIDVRRLQTLLATKPEIYPDGLITGHFSSLTRRAVQRFQLEYGVVISESDPGFGYVGPQTRRKLKEVFGK